MSLNDFMMKIPPQALLGLAGGLLQPGQSQGARFGAGIAGMNQGMLVAQLMEERQQKQKREKEQLEALQRFGQSLDKNGADPYADSFAQNRASGQASVEGSLFQPQERMKSQFSPAQDLMTVAPDAVVKSQLTAKDPWDKYKVAGRDIWEVGPDGKPRIVGSSADTPTPTELSRLIAERNALKPDDPNRPVYDQAISKQVSQTGMSIRTNPDGSVEIIQGPGAGTEGLTNKTRNDLQATTVQAREGLARLRAIKTQFRPEYQQLGPRWANLATAWKDKAGMSVGKADAENLRKFSQFKADALNNINLYIKEITGAAMSNAEAERIQKGVPNPGSGLIDGDSPVEFASKLDGTTRRLSEVNARAMYALKHGLTTDQMFAIPLDTVPGLIDKRGADLEAEVKRQNPAITEEELRALVAERLLQEFGQ